MLKQLFDIQPLVPDLESGTLVLTPNNRLTSKISDAWGAHLKTPAWKTPNVFALESWISELWLQLQSQAWPGADIAIIEPAQQLLLWEQAINSDPNKPPLLNTIGLARAAIQASSNLQLWDVTQSELNEHLSHTGLQLVERWQKDVAARMQELNLAHPNHRLQCLIEAFNASVKQQILIRPEKILLVDFQSLSPLYRQLLEAACDCLTEYQATDKAPTESQLVSCMDSESELQQAARWAKNLLEHDISTRIGVIIPDLPNRRQQVERVFRETFEPSYALPSTDRYTAPFNISTATPLADLPMVAAALGLLKLNHYQSTQDHFLAVLRSPFWGDINIERPARTVASSQLKQLEELTLRAHRFREICATAEMAFLNDTNQQASGTLDLFAEQSTSEEENQSSSFTSRLNRCESLRRTAPTTANFTFWRQYIEKQLAVLGWPGTRPLDSVEYQQLEHWQSLLDRFASLSVVSSGLPLQDAIKELERLAQTTPFQAETEDSPLQILGLLEGAGLRFDHLWMIGADDRQWPQTPEPNPLLPFSLQRQLDMPRASAERELELSQKILKTYWQRCDHVIFSFCQFDGDAEYQASSLITNLIDEGITEPAISSSSLDDYQNLPAVISSQIKDRKRLQIIDTRAAPAINTDFETIRGGAGLLKDQATCPFNAFARWRLGARQPNLPEIGLSALERGTILHDVLDQCWEVIGDQSQLIRFSTEQQQELISDTSQRILQRWRSRKPQLAEQYFQLELERINKLTNNWLNMEKTRTPFRVAAREASLNVQFSGLPLTLRLDRIDKTDNGETILIDYKTGSPTVAGWLNERLSEPQLPLYATLLQQTEGQGPAAISYGIINAKEQLLLGLAAHDTLLPDNNRRKPTLPEWQQQLDLWNERLTDIANEISSGEASVTCYHKASFDFQQELLPINRWPEREQLLRYMEHLDSEVTP